MRSPLRRPGVRRHANPCECTDPGCPKHKGKSECPSAGRRLVFRSDMEDVSGTLMCPKCAEDAMSSGVFYTRN